MGRALAIQLATKENISGLAICDVNEKELLETVKLASSKGVRVTSAIVDVSNNQQVLGWRDQIVKDFGGCDVLFNNAGINACGRLVYGPQDNIEAIEKGWDRCFNIDFYGVLFCMRAFLPVLISRKEAYLINTSSVNAFYTWPEHSAYTAAKHAVKGLTDSVAIELRAKAPHVKVALLHPGGVKTNIAATTLHEHNNTGNENAMNVTRAFEFIADLSSEQAADWIIGAVKKDQYRVLVGYDAWLLDKMVRVFPESIYSFYEQIGREGLIVDPFDPSNKNAQIFGPGVLARIVASGLWTHLLFLWPVPLIKLRHTPTGRAALYGAAATLGYTLINGLLSKNSKL
jgi:NAD(P)-dependent dehydrogenase (short-subunit alcohol dehydrogenase family)